MRVESPQVTATASTKKSPQINMDNTLLDESLTESPQVNLDNTVLDESLTECFFRQDTPPDDMSSKKSHRLNSTVFEQSNLSINLDIDDDHAP